MNIKPIEIDPIRIQIKSSYNVPPVVSGINPPVTVDIGLPIVQIPGCVEARNSTSSTLPTDDPKGNFTVCDAGLPSYDPLQYEPNQVILTTPAEVPKVPEPPEPPVPEIPEIPKTPPQTVVLEEEKVETEPEIPWVEEYLPPVSTVTTTASIAVVATTSALLAKPLADFLLKLIKPTIKKIITKLKTMIGKKVKVESLRERRGQQRSRNKAVRVLKGRE